MPTAIQRVFLGWDAPALLHAAALLVDHYTVGNQLPMMNAVVAMPGSRAGRRLLELLVESADTHHLQLLPPRIITTGALPELLYQPPQPPADKLTTRRAWSLALQQLPADLLDRLMAVRPAAADAAAWDAMAQLIQQLHMDLMAEGIQFADVPTRAQTLDGFTDTDRWAALAQVQQIYRRILLDADRIDTQDARQQAIDDGRCCTTADLWLIGVAEMNSQLRNMLLACDTPVRVLVHAPQSLADHYDELGTVHVEIWRKSQVQLSDDHLYIASRPIDQAAEAVRQVAALNAAYSAEQITLGICDDQVAPHIHQQLESHKVPVRYAAGLPMPRTAVYRLLEIIAEFLNERRFSQFASLVRHPDLTDWLLTHAAKADQTLEAIDDWADLLDRYYNDHLQARLAGRWLGQGLQRDRMTALWQLVHDTLFTRFQQSRPLREWASAILQLLLDVYAARDLNPHDSADRFTVESMQQIAEVLRSLAQLPESLDESVAASQAIDIVLRQLADQSVPPQPLDPAVEMLGWLELHLDDADALIVTGFNEGSLPQSVTGHAFLPDSLRTALGLMNNDRRYARDCYQMTAILHSRPVVRWISGRQSAAGDPLTPSRLMFAADPQTIAQRVLKFYRDDPDAAPPIPSDSTAARSRFILPPQRVLQQPWPHNYLSITDFATYLEDPYRFSLTRILNLQDISDAAAEMDGGMFGRLAHEVFASFGHSDLIASTDAAAISKFLTAQLDELVATRFGSDPQPAVRVQLAQLLFRLAAFAQRQSQWATQGWTIRYVEQKFTGQQASIIVDGQPMYLHGRIDRIDYNPDLKQWAIFDYKTSDTGDLPDKSHRRGRSASRQWIDLQLPLYRRLFASMIDDAGKPLIDPSIINDPARLGLGYILLPRDSANVAFELAPWTAADLLSADEVAAQVIRGVRSGRFEFDPRRRLRFAAFDPFAALCGIDLFSDDDDSDDEGGES